MYLYKYSTYVFVYINAMYLYMYVYISLRIYKCPNAFINTAVYFINVALHLYIMSCVMIHVILTCTCVCHNIIGARHIYML